ncbi:NAD(P)H-dependent oxidoreductase [Pseudoalteromonas sp. OOF1S-7]|uniref:flavodoxin family protein n=1 Tax=Pseudoalteromonas sp. OOF1S-7 TaxID=2917757 RepID=UPI001EF5647D|nr:NAD(P)H-dependent oxidoreductase [Pseudoalteromonas sp. OOF1S-7]MCG7534227.1 NAD(P)H-dependent oxidoreductase [Pseudoalteromonas sp. OOF1S-7]
MKSIILYSSSNKQGNTAQSAQQLAQLLQAETLYLDDYEIKDYCYNHSNSEDDFRALFRSLLDYDHLVFASPVYWYAITPRMKAFFDRITDFMDDETLKPELRKLRTKEFSILSNSIHETAPTCFTEMIQKTCEYLGMTCRERIHHQYPCEDNK